MYLHSWYVRVSQRVSVVYKCFWIGLVIGILQKHRRVSFFTDVPLTGINDRRCYEPTLIMVNTIILIFENKAESTQRQKYCSSIFIDVVWWDNSVLQLWRKRWIYWFGLGHATRIGSTVISCCCCCYIVLLLVESRNMLTGDAKVIVASVGWREWRTVTLEFNFKLSSLHTWQWWCEHAARTRTEEM